MQQCSAVSVTRSETHALASTSGRGRSASTHVHTSSLSRRGHVSAVPRIQYTQAHPLLRLVTAAASSSSSSSSRHGSTAHREPLTDGVEGLRGADATSERWQHGDDRAVQIAPQSPPAAAAGRNRNNVSSETGNGNGRVTAHDVAGDSVWLDEHSGSNGAGNHDAAGPWNGAGTAGSDAEEDAADTCTGSEPHSDVEEEDEGDVRPSASPAFAEAETSVPERVRLWELSCCRTWAQNPAVDSYDSGATRPGCTSSARSRPDLKAYFCTSASRSCRCTCV